MNTNYKNLYNKYKPNGIEKSLSGGWQHHALTSDVGSVSQIPGSIMAVKPTTVTK